MHHRTFGHLFESRVAECMFFNLRRFLFVKIFVSFGIVQLQYAFGRFDHTDTSFLPFGAKGLATQFTDPCGVVAFDNNNVTAQEW